MKLKDLMDWLSHPVTAEIVGTLVTLSILIGLDRLDDRLHVLEVQNEWRLEQEARKLKDELS